jgi:hypothetical protein
VAFDNDLVAVSGTMPADATSAGVIVVHYRPGVTNVTPGGGANKGKPMSYWNLVTRYEQVGEWKGGAQRFPVKCPSACVVMVQKNGAEGMVIGAVQKKK